MINYYYRQTVSCCSSRHWQLWPFLFPETENWHPKKVIEAYFLVDCLPVRGNSLPNVFLRHCLVDSEGFAYFSKHLETFNSFDSRTRHSGSVFPQQYLEPAFRHKSTAT